MCSPILFRLSVPKIVPEYVPPFCSIYVPQAQDAPVTHQNGCRRRYRIKVAGLCIRMKDAKMRQYVRDRAAAGLKQKQWNSNAAEEGSSGKQYCGRMEQKGGTKFAAKVQQKAEGA